MPPKPKLTKDDITDAAFNHVRKNGWKGLTARSLAEDLNTSTKPIYFYFNSMTELEEMVVKMIMDKILIYTTANRTGDTWIDQGMGVVLFAIEEKHLFRAIFDDKHVEARKKFSIHVWATVKKDIEDYPLFKGLGENQVEMIRRARWVYIHGLASLMNISNWPWTKENVPLLAHMIKRVSHAIYNEFKNDPDELLSKDHFRNPTETEQK